MKLSTTLAGLALAGAVTVGSIGAAGAAFAATDGSTPVTPPASTSHVDKVADRCGKAPQVEEKIKDRLSKLNDRITKLQALLAKAQPGSRRAHRLEQRIDTLKKHVVRLTTREAKIEAWVSAHCSATKA